ncbi:hypothetical protein V5O48_019610, partial [Marasmius crinis-equi]
YNQWWDPQLKIAEGDMLASGADDIMTALLDNLTRAVKQLDTETLNVSTEFPADAEGNPRFPIIDTDEIRAGEARTILDDFFKTLWIHSGRRGVIQYAEIAKAPNDFYDTLSFPSGIELANP